MNLKNGKVFTSKFVGTGPSSYEKRIYRAVVSQSLRNNVSRGTFSGKVDTLMPIESCLPRLPPSAVIREYCEHAQ